MKTSQLNIIEQELNDALVAKKTQTRVMNTINDILKKHNVKLDSTTAKGQTLMHIAAAKRHIILIPHLSALVNTADETGMLPLHLAAEINSVDTTALLIECGAYVNAADQNGCTALHLAAINENLAMATALLQHGANVNIKDSIFGYTPLQIARQSSDINMINLLSPFEIIELDNNTSYQSAPIFDLEKAELDQQINELVDQMQKDKTICSLLSPPSTPVFTRKRKAFTALNTNTLYNEDEDLTVLAKRPTFGAEFQTIPTTPLRNR